MTKASDNVFPKIIGAEGAAPGTPAAATAIAYVKADGLWYSKDDAGVETLMSSGPPSAASDLVSGSFKRTTADYTTTSATFVDVDATNFAITKTTGARRCLVGLVAACQTTGGAAGDAVIITLLVDGVNVGGSVGGLVGARFSTTGYRQTVSFTFMTDVLSVGSHTFKLQWYRAAGSGTITMFGGTGGEATAQFWVTELYAV